MPRSNATVVPFPVRHSSSPLLADLTDAIRVITRGLFDPYRPERHYMRGPGPAWQAKHGRVATSSAMPAGLKAAA